MRLSLEVVSDVLEAKKALLKRSQMVEFVEAGDTLANVGGLDNLKCWLALRRGAWEDSAREFGLEPPHGVIILGVQGCGKSLCARGVAGEWNLPLVKFDTSAVYDKYIGETEKRIRKVFRVAEGLAPCVLWVDELEKVFAGSGRGFSLGRCRGFVAPAGRVSLLDAGTQSSRVRRSNLQQRERTAAGADPQGSL